MELNARQFELLNFVIDAHGEQQRKGGEPYVEHLKRVAKDASKFHPLGWEVGICHDLIEDTDVSVEMLDSYLLELGYTRNDSWFITSHVMHLTDLYTKEDFPSLNRRKRKELEITRLGNTPELSQTIKYIDLIDNTKTIVEVDKNFARVYLREKYKTLMVMTAGDYVKRTECLEVLAHGLIKLL